MIFHLIFPYFSHNFHHFLPFSHISSIFPPILLNSPSSSPSFSLSPFPISPSAYPSHPYYIPYHAREMLRIITEHPILSNPSYLYEASYLYEGIISFILIFCNTCNASNTSLPKFTLDFLYTLTIIYLNVYTIHAGKHSELLELSPSKLPCAL